MKRRNFIKTGVAIAGASALSKVGRAATASNWEKEGAMLLADPAAVKAKILARAKEVFAANKVVSRIGVFHLPSKSNYRRFFAWDSGWNVISQSAFDPEGAYQELLAIFTGLQDETGHVAHEALVPEYSPKTDSTYAAFGKSYFDNQGRSFLVDPPSFLVAAEVLYNRTKDPRVLALLPQMQKCLDYLTGPRDLFGDGLVSIIHPWEAGTDLAPVFDEAFDYNINDPFAFVKIVRKFSKFIADAYTDKWDLNKIAERNEFVFEDLCMNALTAAGAVSLSSLYLAAGQKAKSEQCRAVAQKMIAALERIDWDNERAFFFPRWDLKRKKIAKRTSVPGMLPLLTGLVSEDQARKVIDSYLLSPTQFWGPWLVPFNSISEMKAENTLFVRAQLWRGPCIWINMNWMAARLAAKYGRSDVAKKITQATAVLIARDDFREYYDPDTGKGTGAKTFTWPALVLDMIAEHGM